MKRGPGAARRRARAAAAAVAAAPPPARGALWAVLALGVVGVLLSVLLTRVHAQAHAGVASFCTINDVVNCDRVATSPYSVLLGLPVSVWGILGYGLVVALATSGLVRRAPGGGWPGGALVVVCAVAALASVVLAAVSEIAIGALCLLCAASWLVSLALLAVAWRACRPRGVGPSIRGDLALLRARPGRVFLVAAVAGVAVATAAVAYPRYWERAPVARKGPVPAPGPGGAASPSRTAGAAGGRTVVVEYSDYECPYCAKAHEETRDLLRQRPDIEIDHRQFPLDATCNPAVKRTLHPSACDLARAGICAREQGRGAEMDDALFRNQREGAALAAVAERLGLDLPRFRACIGSPQTDRKLAADIEAGIRDGVRATPSYVVAGTTRAGDFPIDLVPAPAGQADAGR